MGKKSPAGLWIAAAVCLAVFLTLFGIYRGLLPGFSGKSLPSPALSGQSLPDRETWMKITQNEKKIGYVHTVFKKEGDGYNLEERMFLQVMVMGLTHRVGFYLAAVLDKGLRLRSFESRVQSRQFEFLAAGRVVDKALIVTTEAEGESREIRRPVDEIPYLSAGLSYAVCNSGMAPKDSISLSVFDPSGMAVVPVRITMAEKGSIKIMGLNRAATRLLVDFKGVTQEVWISEDGEVLKESGLMGLSLEKTDKHEALAKIDIEAGDLTEMMAIVSNVIFDDPEQLKMLKVKIEDVDLEQLALRGGRQLLSGRELVIKKESRPGYESDTDQEEDLAEFLRPDAFIQSDDPAIKQLAAEIVSVGGPVREQARQLMTWVYQNIEKRPVLSVPNALSTLTQRQGDCNEHAMLLAALAFFTTPGTGFTRTDGLPPTLFSGKCRRM